MGSHNVASDIITSKLILPVRILHKDHITDFHETSKGTIGKQTNIFHLTR